MHACRCVSVTLSACMRFSRSSASFWVRSISRSCNTCSWSLISESCGLRLLEMLVAPSITTLIPPTLNQSLPRSSIARILVLIVLCEQHRLRIRVYSALCSPDGFISHSLFQRKQMVSLSKECAHFATEEMRWLIDRVFSQYQHKQLR